MNKKILIIEDESSIADTIDYSLKSDGFKTLWKSTGTEGLDAISEFCPNLIILDIGLPDINGFELLKELRKHSNVPVLILTARSEEIDRILGLELGADDYVVKPFSPREITARVKAILRRATDSSANSETPFNIDMNRRIISFFGSKLSLSRYEFDILSLLIGRPGWVFSREQIMDLIWDEPEESFERTVDAHIKGIRAKLRDVRDDIDPIETRRGMGYALKEKL
jgi:two-component system catabolic regulation response regulator CreB